MRGEKTSSSYKAQSKDSYYARNSNYD